VKLYTFHRGKGRVEKKGGGEKGKKNREAPAPNCPYRPVPSFFLFNGVRRGEKKRRRKKKKEGEKGGKEKGRKDSVACWLPNAHVYYHCREEKGKREGRGKREEHVQIGVFFHSPHLLCSN